MTTRLRQILYLADLSSASDPGWAQVQELARLFGAEILLVDGTVPPLRAPAGQLSLRPAGTWAATARRRADDRVASLLGRLADPRIRVRSRLDEGPAAAAGLAVAHTEGVDLIVMGVCGDSEGGRMIPGSVAERVIRLAPCPVLTVRAALVESLTASPGLARIGYATDFSPSARAAWPWALAIALAASARVDLLHVTSVPVPTSYLSRDMLGRMAGLLREAGEAGIARLLAESSLPRDRVRGLVRSGDAGTEISRWAAEGALDLLVVGALGLSGLTRATVGSVARRVVEAAPCPVLTARPARRAASTDTTATPTPAQ